MFADILDRCRDLFPTDRHDLEYLFRRHASQEEPSWLTDRELFANLSRHDLTLAPLRKAARRQDEEEMGAALLEHFRKRLLPRFPFSTADREETAVRLLEDRDASMRLRAWAEQLCKRVFFSIYHGTVDMSTCLDWYSDLAGKSWFYEHVRGMREKIFKDRIHDTLHMAPLRGTWDLNALHHLVELGKAYWISGEERYASQYVLQALDWMEKNPPNMGVNWIDEMAVARRAIAWILTLHLFLPSPHVTGDFILRFTKMALMHGAYLAEYLRKSRDEDRPGYRLAATSALYMVATDLPEFRSCGRWKEFAEVLLPAALADEFGDRGGHRSGSLDMHRLCCEFAILPHLLARLNGGGLAAETEERTMTAFRFLVGVQEPQGTCQPMGACWPERALCMGPPFQADLPGLLAVAAVLFRRPDFRQAARRTWSLTWLLGLDGADRFERMERQVPSDEPVELYPQASLAVLRDGWNEKAVWAAVRIVPPRESDVGDAHDDLLHVSLAVAGHRLFTDTGALIFHDQRADYFDSPMAHNTLVVGGAIPVPAGEGGVEPGGLQHFNDGRVWVRAGRRAWSRAGKLVWHRRDLLFDPKQETMAICEALEGEGVAEVDISFHTPIEVEVVQRGDFGCIFWKRTGLLRLHPYFPETFRGFVEKGRERAYPAFGCRDGLHVEALQRVRYSAKLELPSWVIFWMTWNVGSAVTPSMEEARSIFLDLGPRASSEPGNRRRAQPDQRLRLPFEP